MRRWQQRVYAMLTVFVMLFCSIDFSSLAEKSSGGGTTYRQRSVTSRSMSTQMIVMSPS